MSTSYTIIIKNQSPENEQYLLFNKPPKPAPGTDSGFSNVWIKTGGTPTPHGEQHVTITMDTFAVCGNTTKTLKAGVVCEASDYVSVALTASSTAPGTVPQMAVVAGNPAFVTPFKTTNTASSFGIHTLGWNPAESPNVFCGLGRYTPQGDVMPVAVFKAKPHQTYILEPVEIFYVTTGSFSVGEAVNVTDLGDIATVDFTKALSGQTVATVVQLPDYSYAPTVYSYPHQKNGDDRLSIEDVENADGA